MATAQAQAQALVIVARAIHEAVQTTGATGIPSGHLYAMMMEHISLEVFELCVQALVEAGKITNKGHLLQAVAQKEVER